MLSTFKRAGARSSAANVKRERDDSSEPTSRQESESQVEEEEEDESGEDDEDEDEEDDEEEEEEEEDEVAKFVKTEAEEASEEEEEDEEEEEEEEEEDEDDEDEDEDEEDQIEAPKTKTPALNGLQAQRPAAAGATKKTAAVSATTTSDDSDSDDSDGSDDSDSSDDSSSSEDDSDGDSDDADEATKEMETAPTSSQQKSAGANKMSPQQATNAKAPAPEDDSDDEDSGGVDNDSGEDADEAEEEPAKSQESAKATVAPAVVPASPKKATALSADNKTSPEKKAASTQHLAGSQSSRHGGEASQSSYDLPQQPIPADNISSSSDDDLDEIPNVWPPPGLDKYLDPPKDTEIEDDEAGAAAQLEAESQANEPEQLAVADPDPSPPTTSRLPNLTDAKKKRGGRRQISKPTFVEQALEESAVAMDRNEAAEAAEPTEEPAVASSSQSSRRRNTRKALATPVYTAPEPLQEPLKMLPEPIPEEQLQAEETQAEKDEAEEEEEEAVPEEEGSEPPDKDEEQAEQIPNEEEEIQAPNEEEEVQAPDEEQEEAAPEEEAPASESPASKPPASEPETPAMNSELSKTPRTKSTARRSLPGPGVFTDMELHRLRQAASTYRDLTNVDEHSFNDMVQGVAKSHKELWNHMAEACPDRPRIKVILRCRRMFNNFHSPYKWTPEQDAELAELVAKHGTKWTEIGGMINRSQEDVRKRWEDSVVYGDKPQMFYWTFEEESRLGSIVGQMLKDIQTSRGIDVRTIDRDAELSIPWQQVSDRMEHTRTARQCRIKWFQIRQAYHFDRSGKFVGPPEPVQPTWSQKRAAKIQGVAAIGQPLLGLGEIEDGLRVPGTGRKISDKTRTQMRKMTPRDRYRLVKSIRASNVGSDNYIPWHRLVNAEFRAKWSRATRELMWSRLKRTVPRFQRMPVREIAEYLLKDFETHQQVGEGWDIDFGGEPELDPAGDDEEQEDPSEEVSESTKKPEDRDENEDGGNEDNSELPSSLSRTPAAKAAAKRKATRNGRKKLVDRMRTLQQGQEEEAEEEAGEARGEEIAESQEMDHEKHVSESEHEDEGHSSKRRRKTFTTATAIQTNGRGRSGTSSVSSNSRSTRSNGARKAMSGFVVESDADEEDERNQGHGNQNGKRPAEDDIEDVEEPVAEEEGEDEEVVTRGDREASVDLGQRTPTPPPLTQSLSPSMAKDKPVLANKLKRQRQQNGNGEAGGGLLSAGAERFGSLSSRDKSASRRLKKRALTGSFVDEIEDVEESPVRPRPAKRRR